MTLTFVLVDDLDAVRAMVLMGDIIACLAVVVMLVAFVLETARDLTSRWTKLVVASAALLAGELRDHWGWRGGG